MCARFAATHALIETATSHHSISTVPAQLAVAIIAHTADFIGDGKFATGKKRRPQRVKVSKT